MIHISEAAAKVIIGLASTYAKTKGERRAIRELAEALRNPETVERPRATRNPDSRPVLFESGDTEREP